MLQSRPLTNPTSSRRPAAPTQARDALATAGNPPLRPHYQADSVSEAPCSTHSEGAPPLSDSGPAAAALLPLLRGLCRDRQRRLLRVPSRRSTGPAWETQLPQPTCTACKGLRSPSWAQVSGLSPLTWCWHAACEADRHTSICSAPWHVRNWQKRQGGSISSSHSQLAHAEQSQQAARPLTAAVRCNLLRMPCQAGRTRTGEGGREKGRWLLSCGPAGSREGPRGPACRSRQRPAC